MTVIAHHLVWTAYGTWLGNDPRGSGSRSVYAPALAELAEPHFGRRQIQPSRQVVREFYAAARPRLQHSVIRFNTAQIQAIGRAFGQIVAKHSYTCYSCAIMPDHVHLVIRKHRHTGEEMIDHLQRGSRLRFSFEYALPNNHPLWTRGGWDRFLDSPGAVRSRVRYVDANPEKEGLARQAWPFEVEYDGWPVRGKRPPR